MKEMIIILFAITSLFSQPDTEATGQYYSNTGEVSFGSYAALETIKASSSNLKGVIETGTRKFAFSVSIRSFMGFNSPLQREHFNENYLESILFPTATFTGKIIENIDFDKDGTYSVRAKGKLTIHGVAQERIIKSEVVIKDKKIKVNSDFDILLKEHNIIVPKIVNQKIANKINVKVATELLPKP